MRRSFFGHFFLEINLGPDRHSDNWGDLVPLYLWATLLFQILMPQRAIRGKTLRRANAEMICVICSGVNAALTPLSTNVVRLGTLDPA